MRSPLGAFLFVVLLLLIDTYVFQSLKTVTAGSATRTRQWIYAAYWLVSVLVISGFVLFAATKPGLLPKAFRTYMFAIVVGLFLAKLVAVVFVFLDDVRRAVTWVVLKLAKLGSESADTGPEDGITRSVFLSWLGLAAGSTLFGTLLYGFGNKHKYQIKRVPLYFENLPLSFDGLKVIQISDIHSGSFTSKEGVEKGIDLILAEKPDLILFTGDLVNDMASEMEPWEALFSRLKAPMGVYSTLGNHDYGDYVRWPINGVSKEENLHRLKQLQARMGWRLLMNEHVALTRGGESIALLGIENWSAKGRFPKHGRMDLAYPGTEHYPFKILMSHDPSHWEAEVQQKYGAIDLMLSGHTHGMQFGIEIPGFKWSPVQYMYKQWAGLYTKGRQHLYVNRGFGFIGYPGRVGILPEISVLELHHAKTK